jgi:hypothetical protein
VSRDHDVTTTARSHFCDGRPRASDVPILVGEKMEKLFPLAM